MLSQLEVGDTIVTIGGIYGTIVRIGGERLLIEVADGSRLELARRAVGSVVPPDAEDDAPLGIDEAAPELGAGEADGPNGDDA